MHSITCPHCQKVFEFPSKRKASIREHLLAEHPHIHLRCEQRGAAETNRVWFRCVLCDETYNDLSVYELHLVTHHEAEQMDFDSNAVPLDTMDKTCKLHMLRQRRTCKREPDLFGALEISHV
ncbi:hypothetical protein 4 [Beihai tombus-like virus 7]|uniref:hypothetical protein 4 n=1 Tax=Beihai tombus-like virus 7 TaxID=1922728 RepID=UPI00090A27CD|nr:hypothetical protein 4 [Beihai tombus-like virus 7]APG76112.1 hypothetical protein 4 [Beihai tombus-like virus 7]